MNLMELSLENLSLEEAKSIAISIVKERKTKTINQKTAKMQVIRDIEKAETSQEVSRIMWMQKLASEGLRITGSAWEQKYRNI